MNETGNTIWVFVTGLILGTLFFGGLWYTVKKTITSTKPAFLVLVSFVSRMVIVLIGFYFIGAGNWQRLLIALLGFIIARFIVIYLTRAKQVIVKEEVDHET